LAKISGVKFDDGGLAFSGGNIPTMGGMITGQPHSRGGVKFWMGGGIGEADGQKGEAYIVNTANDPVLRSLASRLNVAGGGKAFNDGGIATFQDGGVSSGITQQVFGDVLVGDQVLEVVRAMQIFVSVEEFEEVQANKNSTEARAVI
jgi:hypothetical protein